MEKVIAKNCKNWDYWMSFRGIDRISIIIVGGMFYRITRLIMHACWIESQHIWMLVAFSWSHWNANVLGSHSSAFAFLRFSGTEKTYRNTLMYCNGNVAYIVTTTVHTTPHVAYPHVTHVEITYESPWVSGLDKECQIRTALVLNMINSMAPT